MLNFNILISIPLIHSKNLPVPVSPVPRVPVMKNNSIRLYGD